MSNRRRARTVLALLAMIVLVFAAAGCGSDDDEGDDAAPPAATGDTTETTQGETISVGLVTDTGGVDDDGFNEFSIQGFERAQEELGVEGRVYVSRSADDYLPNLTAAAEDGHDLVIAVGFLLAPATVQVAAEFPDTSFGGVDHFYGGEGCEEQKTCEQPNALGMQYPSEESGYLAGIVAAMISKSKTVSTVGGIKIPPVDNWIAGFQQGVIDTDPSVKFLNAYSQDFDDQAKCKEVALDQIGRGSDVVFQVAGACGLGAIDAACQEGKWAIGVDADQSAAGDCVVTSALKPLSESVYELIKSTQEGNFEGGTNQFYGVEQLEDPQLLAPFSDDVPQDVQDAVAEARQKLIDGEIDPPATIDEVEKS